MATAGDDDWDRLIDPHAAAVELGRQEGRTAGLEAGYQSGYDLGQTTAIDQALPLGFVRGMVAACRENTHLSSRVAKTLDDLERILMEMPNPELLWKQQDYDDQNGDNDETEKPPPRLDQAPDMRQYLQRVQARFRLLIAQLGCPHLTLQSVLEGTEPQSTPSEW